MRIPRFYLPQPLAIETVLSLPEDLGHRLTAVLRLDVGAAVIVFNGRGGEYQASIIRKQKRHVDLLIHAFDPIERKRQLSIHLGQVISRGERMDYTLQKVVELGVASITPLTSEFCTVKVDAERAEKKHSHWDKIIIHACEQSGRTDKPPLYPVQSLTSWVSSCTHRQKLMLDPQGQTPLSGVNLHKAGYALLIGGEGGLSQQEISFSQQQGFLSLHLGALILRTETAGVVAMAGLHALYGE